MVLGFPAGSPPDIVTRVVAEKMVESLGQPVLTDNRPGAGGTLATEAVVRAAADGHTLLVSGCSGDGILYAFIMSGRRPYEPLQDFTPVGRMMRDHWILAVPISQPASSVEELVAASKSKPGGLSFPSSGAGSSAHLQSERFSRRVGMTATHVPYKDNAVPDLVAGRLDFALQPAAAMAPLIRAGKLKGLALLSSARLDALPNVPAVSELGLSDLVYNAGVCLYAPKGTQARAVSRLNAALNAAQGDPAVAKRFSELGVETVHGNAEDAARFVGELTATVDRMREQVFGKAR